MSVSQSLTVLTMHKDFLDQPLTVGDTVVVAQGGSNYATYLDKGEIVGFTPKNARVKFSEKTWRSKVLVPFNKLVKITEK